MSKNLKSFQKKGKLRKPHGKASEEKAGPQNNLFQRYESESKLNFQKPFSNSLEPNQNKEH
jgi:hypothetical protein